MTPGQIYNARRYKQAKMLDHSEWFGLIRSGITPCDVDMVWDNNGYVLLCEIARVSEWRMISAGQRWTYEALIKGTNKHLAVLVTHNVDEEKQIKTLSDVISFQILFDLENGPFRLSSVVDGKFWQTFVQSWYKNPQSVIERVRLSGGEDLIFIDDIQFKNQPDLFE